MRYLIDVDAQRFVVDVDGETVRVDGDELRARLTDIPGTPVQLVAVGREVHRLLARRGDSRGRYTLSLDGFRYEVDALDERARAIRELAVQRGPAGPAPVVAPMPGLVVRINVQVGDEVRAGQGVVVMEAMKMENELRAPAAGRVRRVLAEPGKPVEKGTVLVEME